MRSSKTLQNNIALTVEIVQNRWRNTAVKHRLSLSCQHALRNTSTFPMTAEGNEKLSTLRNAA